MKGFIGKDARGFGQVRGEFVNGREIMIGGRH
jgi:hypothetical protein